MFAIRWIESQHRWNNGYLQRANGNEPHAPFIPTKQTGLMTLQIYGCHVLMIEVMIKHFTTPYDNKGQCVNNSENKEWINSKQGLVKVEMLVILT